MDSIRQWAFGVCAAAIACGLAQLVLPKSSMQQVFNITSSVFFLGCLLSPIAFSAIDVELIPQEEIQRQVEERAGRLSEAVEQQQEELATESVRLAAAETLDEMGIPYQKIYINVHVDEEDGISISECEVQLEDSYRPRHDEIYTALKDRLGVTVHIGYQEEVTA